MRYQIAVAIGFLVLSQSAGAAPDSKCMLNCYAAGMKTNQCTFICSNNQAQDESDSSPGGFIGGYMKGEQERAQQEKLAAEAQLLKEQTRAIELENQRRTLELESQQSDVGRLQGGDRAAVTTDKVPPADVTLARQMTYRDWQLAMASRKSRYPDFDTVVFVPDNPVNQDMIQWMAISPYAADIAYYLGTHRQEAQQIAALRFLDTGRAIKEVEARLASTPQR